jgi:hypothetical protein
MSAEIMLVYLKLRRIWNEMIVVYLKVPIQHSPGGTEEYHDKHIRVAGLRTYNRSLILLITKQVYNHRDLRRREFEYNQINGKIGSKTKGDIIIS